MFGAIAFASSIIVIVETITDWGFNYTATRDVAIVREDLKEVSNIYSQVLYARILLMVICFVLLLALVETVPQLKENKTVILITFLYIPGNILFPQWLFQAFEKMGYITVLSIISRLFFIALIFVVIKQETDYIFEPLLNGCGFIVSGIIAQYIILKKFGLRFKRPNFKEIWIRIKASYDMFMSLILPNFYTSFTTIILKVYCGELATGIYNGGQRFQSIIDNLTQILSRTFFPFLARNRSKHHVYVIISGSIAIIASLLMFFGAELFVKIFLTPEFKDAIKVMKIFSITPIFLFLMNTYGTNYLVVVGKEKILRNIIIVVSIIGFAITWWLTPLYSYIGAALTVTFVWGIRGITTYYFAKKVKAESKV